MTPQEFEGAFPAVLDWIQQTLLAHKSRARPIASKKFKRLPLYFSQAQIRATKFVIVERVPVPHRKIAPHHVAPRHARLVPAQAERLQRRRDLVTAGGQAHDLSPGKGPSDSETCA